MIEKEIKITIEDKTYCGLQIIDGDYHVVKYKQLSKQDQEIYNSDTICIRASIAESMLRELVLEYKSKYLL